MTLFFFRMSAFDSPLAKPQTSVTNMSANAGAELSIFWQSVLSSNPQTNQGGLKLKLKNHHHKKNNASIEKENYHCTVIEKPSNNLCKSKHWRCIFKMRRNVQKKGKTIHFNFTKDKQLHKYNS